MLKFPNCRNGDRSDVNFNDTSKLLDCENPLFGAWQQGWSDVYFSDTLKLLDLFSAEFVALSLVLVEF